MEKMFKISNVNNKQNKNHIKNLKYLKISNTYWQLKLPANNWNASKFQLYFYNYTYVYKNKISLIFKWWISKKLIENYFEF